MKAYLVLINLGYGVKGILDDEFSGELQKLVFQIKSKHRDIYQIFMHESRALIYVK